MKLPSNVSLITAPAAHLTGRTLLDQALRSTELNPVEMRKVSAATNKRDFESLSTGFVKASMDNDRRLADYLREGSVFDLVMPADQIDVSQLEQGYATDTLLYRIYLSQETTAYRGTFEGGAQSSVEAYIPRVFMTFLLLRTGTMSVNEYNAMTYPGPLIPALEERQVMDLMEAKDLVAWNDVENSIQASRTIFGNVIRGSEARNDILLNGTSTGFQGRIVPADLTSGKKYFASKRTGGARTIVITSVDYLDFENVTLQEAGQDILTRFFDEGITQDTVRGCKLIRTIKCDTTQGDTFRPGNVYFFADPDLIGRNKILRQPRMFVERRRNTVSFDQEMVVGWIIAAPSRICKLELYNGGVGPTVARSVESPVSDLSDIVADFVAGEIPGSDTLFTEPDDVLGKDYIRLDDNLMRPVFSAVGA